MNRNLYLAPMSLLTTLLVFLVVCGASVENRASPASPVSARKPPFNGSIFGKRSVLPALQSMPDGYSYGSIVTGVENSVFDSPDRVQIGLLLQQQEALTRLAIRQCLIQQQQRQASDLEGDPDASSLCANLLGDPRGGSRRNSVADSNWFDRLNTM